MPRKMKDSGVEWIGEIPEGWTITKFNKVINNISTGLNPRQNFVLGEGNNYYVTIKNFKKGKLLLDDKCNRITEKSMIVINERSDLKVNDILFASISKDGEAYLITEIPKNWNINESVFSIRPNAKFILPEFLYTSLTSSYFYDRLQAGATGTTFSSIKINMLKENPITIPPLPTQTRIANYLDKKVSLIDSIIEKTKQTIEEYKAYKQSLITEVVTKGLDKNVKMKDSGIEWIGEIPEGWRISKIGMVYSIYLGKMLQTEKKKETDIKRYYLCSVNVTWNGVNLKTLKKMWIQNNEKGRLLLRKGDLIVSEGGDVGIASIWSEELEECYIQNAVHKVSNSNLGLSSFLYYWLFALKSVGYIDMICNKSTFSHFTKKKFSNSTFLLAPYTQQLKIVRFLDSKTKEIDSLINKKQSLITELESYKKSLIYEVVTGKREV
jgi:type I restriction enzyme S subunit